MEKIYKILEDLRPEFDFHVDVNYIEEGMLDSFDVVALVTDLEKEFGILINALDIVPESFACVHAIAELVEKNGGLIERSSL